MNSPIGNQAFQDPPPPHRLASTEWAGVHQPQLHGPGQELRPEARVHHPIQPVAKRHGRARDQHAQRPIRAQPPLRDPAAHQSRDLGLDRLLQPPAPTPVAGHEAPCLGLCFSSPTAAMRTSDGTKSSCQTFPLGTRQFEKTIGSAANIHNHHRETAEFSNRRLEIFFYR